MFDLVLSITVLAVLALVAGAVLAWRRGSRQQALLMAVLALVAIVNVAIWTMPDSSGEAPLDKIEDGATR